MTNKKILPLILEPNSLLHQKSELVINIDDKIKSFTEKLITTMKYHQGLGLAAVQVGVLKKIVVIEVINIGHEGDKLLNLKEGPMLLINPEIIEQSNYKKTYIEGCLSFGNIFPEVERSNKIKVRYLDLNGDENFLEVADNILSACIQHEVDHTTGIIFLDRLSKMKREFMIKKYLKWRKKNNI